MDARPEILIHEDPDYSNNKILDRPQYRLRRTPVMVTLGDPGIASQDIQKMIELGTNIVKFKTSHCTEGDTIRLLRKMDKAVSILTKRHSVLEWPITTCIELKTSIMKTGFLEGDRSHIILKEGHTVVLIYDVSLFDKCTAHLIFVDNPYIAVEFKPGIKVSIDRNEIILKVKKKIDDKSVQCVVFKSGKLTDMCFVALRGGARTATPIVTKKDYQIIRFAMEHKFDMILINYARRPEALHKVRQFIGKEHKKVILLAGVCTPEGLQNVDSIIKEADGLVFSREYLAYTVEESSQYRMMQMQKLVGAKCLQAGKPFFISGEIYRQALEMGDFVDNETSDITNAILDGATGFVLKECNNVEVLLEVIKAMNELCKSVEPLNNSKTDYWRSIEEIKVPVNAAEASAISCAAIAHQINARVIIIPTVTGYTAKTLLWLRPAAIIITVSTRKSTTRRLQSYRCVVPLLFEGGRFKDWYKAVSARVEFAVEFAVKRNWLRIGNSYVTLQRGSENSAFCDMVRIWNVTITQKSAVMQCEEGMLAKD